LRNLGKSMEHANDDRDTATAACLYGLCLAIRVGVEIELALHMTLMNFDSNADTADVAVKLGDERVH
jgi:hypothetical protein